MRILQVITSLMTGGAERLIVDITKRLREYGHVVDVVVFNGVETPFMRLRARWFPVAKTAPCVTKPAQEASGALTVR